MIVSAKWDYVQRRSADFGLKRVEKPTRISPHYLFVVIDNVNMKRNLCDRAAMTMSGYSSSPSKIVHEVYYGRCIAHMLGSLDWGVTIMLYCTRMYLLIGLLGKLTYRDLLFI